MQDIMNKVDVVVEVYDYILKKVKGMCESRFGKPSSYFDAEKQRIINIAHDIFISSITIEDIENLAKNKTTPKVIDVEAKPEPRKGKGAPDAKKIVSASEKESKDEADAFIMEN